MENPKPIGKMRVIKILIITVLLVGGSTQYVHWIDPLDFDTWDDQNHGMQNYKALESFVAKISPKGVKVKQNMEVKIPNGIITAQMMVDTLSDKDFTVEERRLLKRFYDAISWKESGHKHYLLGVMIKNKGSSHFGTRALGRYQIMPKNWINWCKKYVGRVVAPTPQAQEFVTFKMFLTYRNTYKRGRSEKELYHRLAERWFGGRSKTTLFFWANATKKYADTVVRHMRL